MSTLAVVRRETNSWKWPMCTSLYNFAIVVRLVLGIIFIVAAKASKYPTVIKFLGYLFLAAASLLIFMGQENFQHFINSVIPNLRPFTTLIGLFSMVFGGFLIYAFQGKKIRARVNKTNHQKSI
jgi:hypothetical protein